MDNDVIQSTLCFWLRNRLSGISASMADEGGTIDKGLLKAFDTVRSEVLKNHSSKEG